MVVSKLHFVQVQWEPVRADAMMFQQLSFGVTPEPFQSVDMYAAATETSSVIDTQMPIAVKRQGIVRMVLWSYPGSVDS